MVKLPVFQMTLGVGQNLAPGWLFSDEVGDDYGSFAFVVPALSGDALRDTELRFAGERAGLFEELLLVMEGSWFVERTSGIRFSLEDPAYEMGLRVQSLIPPLPYVGAHSGILIRYGVPGDYPLIALTPLDLHSMDAAYLDQRLIFSGATVSYGAHVQRGFAAWEPYQSSGGRQRTEEILLRSLANLPGGQDVPAKILNDPAREKDGDAFLRRLYAKDCGTTTPAGEALPVITETRKIS